MLRLISAVTLIVLTAGMITLANPAESKGRAPQWCSKIEGHLHCQYYSQAQCQASVSGRTGYCVHLISDIAGKTPRETSAMSASAAVRLGQRFCSRARPIVSTT
jgi:hypothetical protein